MAIQIQVRRDTTANWAAEDPTPAAGEPCLDLDTGVVKWGDGVTAYSALPTPTGTGGGGYTFVQAESISGLPTSPSVGDTWFDPENGNTYLRYNDGTTTQWIQSGTTSALGGAVLSVNTLTGNVVLTADDIDDAATDNKFISGAELTKLATVQAGAVAPLGIRYATRAGVVTNADLVIRGQAPSAGQTLEIQYHPYDAAPTLLATVTITTTADWFPCPVFSQAVRVVTNGNGSITDTDGIAAVITAGPTLPPPIVVFR